MAPMTPSLLLLPSLAASLLLSTARAFGPPLPLPSSSGESTSNSRRTHHVPWRRSHARKRPHHLHRGSVEGDDESEWRAFRAKLVRDGLPSLDDLDDQRTAKEEGADGQKGTANDASYVTSNYDRGYAHETTPLVEAGSILASVPTTDLCQALDQQYWHRSVVLVTDASDNVVRGDVEEDVPEEQLALGDKRGRWSYRGLMLNRCTDGLFSGEHDGTTVEKRRGRLAATGDGNGWRMHRGGDLLGLDSSSGTEFACLHHLGLSDPSVREVSTKLVGNLCCTTLAEARALCRRHPTKHRPEDFLLFGGFCSWRPGQLEREMGPERKEWRVLSVDGGTVWDELQRQRELSDTIIKESRGKGSDVALGLLRIGTDVWRSVLSKIDVSESTATERLPKGQLEFYDRMLAIWAEEKLTADRIDPSTRTILNDSSDGIGPGTVVRATSPPTNDMLLYDAEFVRSLILVLEDAPGATVGIVLNHPMAAAVECREGETPLPLRYGGPVDVPSWRDGSYREGWEDGGEGEGEEEEMYEGFLDYQSGAVSFEDIAFDENSDSFGMDGEDDDSSFLWIHRDARLGSRRHNGGTQLGTSNLWIVKEDDALEALQSGILQAEDVMVFAGVCIWEKGPGVGECGGGLREQIDALGAFEVVRAWDWKGGDDAINEVWDVLKRQTILSKETLDGNIAAAIDAWGLFSDCQARADDGGARVRLSEAALKAWVGVNLLEDPLGTFVDVKDDQPLGQ